MAIRDILKAAQTAPVDQTIDRVTKALAQQPLLVSAKITDSGEIRFQVSQDGQGLLWVYAYTDEPEFSRAFPGGGPYAEMELVDVFTSIAANAQFGGIYINSKSDAMYVLPAQLFNEVAAALGLPPPPRT